jgi:hypothetical protein
MGLNHNHVWKECELSKKGKNKEIRMQKVESFLQAYFGQLEGR